jgi:trans-2,3-dihydro-3-hydroxyanthranilate isomerase
MLTRRTWIEGAAMQVGARSLRYEVWDVFTNRPFGGNPLGVFFEADGLSAEQMFAITREMNHSETTFVTKDLKVRIFTATQELPFAGHPVLGTAFALHRRQPGLKRVVVNVPQGPIPVDFEGETGMMLQQDPEFREIHEASEIAPMLGLKVDDLVSGLPIQNVSTGRPNLIVMLKTMEAMKRVKVDWGALLPYFAKGDVQRGIYLLTKDVLVKGSLVHARKLTPRVEDPATGSAAGCAAAYLAKYGLAGSGATVRMEQGHLMGRPSELLLSATRKADGAVGQVRVGGSSVLVLEGSVNRLA